MNLQPEKKIAGIRPLANNSKQPLDPGALRHRPPDPFRATAARTLLEANFLFGPPAHPQLCTDQLVSSEELPTVACCTAIL